MRSQILAAAYRERQLRGQRRQKAQPIAISAPVGGWNSRDSLDGMKDTEAVVLDNWFPGFGACYIRSGYTPYATGLGGSVQTLAEFNAKGLRKFIAAANGSLWNISAAGTGIALAAGFGSNAWQSAQFDDASGGARSGLVNGADAPQIYDGTTVAAMTISGSGLTPATLNGIHIFKGRSYFWSDLTQDFWYSATNALGGVLTKFPLGRVTNGGGNLLGIGTWSVDAGGGLSDLMVFVLNSGDVLVYAGDDPGTTASWALIGRYNVGAPISKRAIKKVGAELIAVTKAGYVPLVSMLHGGRINEAKTSISSKIRGAALDAVAIYGANFGWEICHYPRKNWMLVNVPLSTTQAHQHVMNTETGAWCRFTGMNALSWSLYNDLLYCGDSSGTVYLADTGFSDNGIAINAYAQSSWNYFDDRRRTKRVSGIRLLFSSTGAPFSYQVGVGADFGYFDTSVITNSGLIVGSSWDSSPWDVTPWASEPVFANNWVSALGDGYCISHSVRIQSNAQAISWLSSNYLIEPGGVL